MGKNRNQNNSKDFTSGDFKDQKRYGKGRQLNMKGKRTNDISWHNHNGQLIKDIFSKPFNHVLGSPINYLKEVMGVCIPYDWYVGDNGSAISHGSTLRLAAVNLYEMLRTKISGNWNNYQPADLIDVIMGALDIFPTIQYAMRFFGIVNYWSTKSRMVPRMLFDMLGVDFDDFVTNIALYRGKMNVILAKASSIRIPKEYPIYEQVLSFFKDVYKDTDTDTGRETLIVFNKAAFHVYDSVGAFDGATIQPVPLPAIYSHVRLLSVREVENGKLFTRAREYDNDPLEVDVFTMMGGDHRGTYNMTFDYMLKALDIMIDSILDDDNFRLISADIVKTFGDESSNYWSFEPISEGYKIEPVYSEEMSDMLHNATFLPQPIITVSTGGPHGITAYQNDEDDPMEVPYRNAITQDENGVLKSEFEYQPMFQGANSHILNIKTCWNNKPIILDEKVESPEAEKICLDTRFKHVTKIDTVAGSTMHSGEFKVQFKPQAMGTVILFSPTFAYVHTNYNGTVDYKIGSTDMNRKGNLLCDYSIVLNSTTAVVSVSKDLNQAQWSNAPLRYECDGNTPGGFVGELTNYIDIPWAELARMHDVDLLSLLNVPRSTSV